MTPEELAAIKARAEAATPGPWRDDIEDTMLLGADGVVVNDDFRRSRTSSLTSGLGQRRTTQSIGSTTMDTTNPETSGGPRPANKPETADLATWPREALVAEVERLRKALDEAQSARDDYFQVLADGAGRE